MEKPAAEKSRAMWSSTEPPPAIGSLVHVKLNGIGMCRVLEYFVFYGWLGLHVRPLNPPEWMLENFERSGVDYTWITGAEAMGSETRPEWVEDYLEAMRKGEEEKFELPSISA